MRLIGREAKLMQARKHLVHHRHTLIVGPVGIGKSALLHAAVEGCERVVALDQITPFRPALLDLFKQLHAQGRLTLPDVDTAYLDWDELTPHVSHLNSVEAVDLLAPLLADTVLLIDDLDGITPTIARLLEPLVETALILGAVTTLDASPELTRWRLHFQLLPLAPLTPEASRELLWASADREALPDADVFEQHVLHMADGNPLAIRELCRQARRTPLRDPADIRHLTHEAGIRDVDLTPLLLIVGACAVAIRFLALGLNDIDTYILAGILGAFLLVSRYMFYRSLRRRG